MTHYGKHRGHGLVVPCRSCDASFEPLKQEYDTTLCPACNANRPPRTE